MKKQAKKIVKKTTKKAAAAKRAKKPAKSAAREDGIFIALDADDATEATEAAKSAKPAAKAKKPTKEKKPAAARPDFKPVELPATFDDEDGFSITVAADSITFTRGMFKVIFSPRRAHFFPRDVSLAGGKPLPRTIKAGSVSLVSGQTGIVISADDADAVAAILTAKAAATEAARKAKGGAA